MNTLRSEAGFVGWVGESERRGWGFGQINLTKKAPLEMTKKGEGKKEQIIEWMGQKIKINIDRLTGLAFFSVRLTLRLGRDGAVNGEKQESFFPGENNDLFNSRIGVGEKYFDLLFGRVKNSKQARNI